uniref:Protein MMS22-like n=1 Tax=Cyprinus carpio TaxID=7962 RepID=A0A8C1L902_CYPCA
MEGEFSQSLTPPVSPSALDHYGESAPSQPACFTCAHEPGREETGRLSSNGYISRGALKRLLLKLDPAPADFEGDTVDIFDFPWVTETALVESTKLLFGLFRQKVLKLETLVQSSSHDFGQASSLHYEAEELRQQCVLFLSYIKVFIYRFLEPSQSLDEGPVHLFKDTEAHLPSVLVEELFSITLLIGRIKNLPANVQSCLPPLQLFPPSVKLLHLHLDIHWSVLEILHLLEQRMMGQVVYAHQFVNLTGETLTNISLFEDQVNNLLCDLIGLAMNKYNKVCVFLTNIVNSSLTVPWLGVSGLGSISRTPLSLLQQAKSCCRPASVGSNSHTQLYRSTNSFHIFLRILALHLSQEHAGGAPWRQIKGRGQLALVLLYLEKGLDAGALAEQLATYFSQAAREFYLKTTEPLRKLALWAPLSSYLEGVSEVFETSPNLALSEERLLNEGFGLLLPACRQSELSSALGFLQTVLAQLRRVHQRCGQQSHSIDFPSWVPLHSVVKERHQAVAAALWSHFFPFLCGMRLSQTPPPQLADAAAGFTLLALDMPGSAPQNLQPHPIQSIMQSFGWDEMLHPLLVTHYLNHLLQNGELVIWVSSGPGSGSAQALCVRAWIRCVLQQYLHKSQDAPDSRAGRNLDEQLAELTRQILQLPEVESVLQRAGLHPVAARDPKPAMAVFIRAVGRSYCELQLLSERSSAVSRALEYVGDILKYIKPYLLNKSREGLQLVYWTVGCLVKHWSYLLATTKAQQLLFRIVDVLLLPHALLQQDSGAHTQMISALKESLPLFLQGLSVAVSVSQSQGAYLKQQLHSVISQYLSRFLPTTPSTGAVVNHPVLLAACESTPTPQGERLRRSILHVLRENFLQFKGLTPIPRLAAVLSFLLELLKRNSDRDPALHTIPLPLVLRCLMLVNEPQEVTQLIVERCTAAAGEQPCEHTTTILQAFVEENEGVYDQQVYNVLEVVAVLHPFTVTALIPFLSLSLRKIECKRGLGKNTSLSNSYLYVNSGQAEMISLEED